MRLLVPRGRRLRRSWPLRAQRPARLRRHRTSRLLRRRPAQVAVRPARPRSAYPLTRRARGLPLWFSLSVHGIAAYTAAIEAAIALARQTAADIRSRDYLELIRQPDLSVVIFRRRGWTAGQYVQWAGRLHSDQVAFIPPSAWEGETVARFAFLHPHTPMELVRQILDRMALTTGGHRHTLAPDPVSPDHAPSGRHRSQQEGEMTSQPAGPGAPDPAAAPVPP